MRRWIAGLSVVVVLSLIMTACGGGGSSNVVRGTTQPTGTVYMTGSDAPLPSVLSFQVTITSATLSNGSTSVALISEPTTIEFSRLLGLRTLLSLNSAPAGSYNSISVTLSNPVISYLDLTTNPASVSTINGTLSRSTININFQQPLVINDQGMGGLHFHFNLRNSLLVDGAGQLTGTVDPHIQIRPLMVNDDDAVIDELRGGLVSVDTANSKFVIQRPNGRNITVKVDSNTAWDGTDTLATLSVPAVMEVAGTVQADGTVLASRVQVITRDRGFVAGIVLGTTPATGAADSVTLLVREEIPAVPGVDVGKPATLAISNSTVFDIYRMDLPVESLLFNRSQLVKGQRVSVGGTFNSANPPTLDTRRVVLHRQGLEGTVVANSLNVTSGNNGSFMLNANGMFGYLFGAPIEVRTTGNTRFKNLSGLSDAGSQTGPIVVVGLLLKDNSGNPVLVASWVGKPDPAN